MVSTDGADSSGGGGRGGERRRSFDREDEQSKGTSRTTTKPTNGNGSHWSRTRDNSNNRRSDVRKRENGKWPREGGSSNGRGGSRESVAAGSLFSRLAHAHDEDKGKERTRAADETAQPEDDDAHQRRIRRLKRRRRSAGLDSDVSEDELVRWSEQAEKAVQKERGGERRERVRSPTTSDRGSSRKRERGREQEDGIDEGDGDDYFERRREREGRQHRNTERIKNDVRSSNVGKRVEDEDRRKYDRWGSTEGWNDREKSRRDDREANRRRKEGGRIDRDVRQTSPNERSTKGSPEAVLLRRRKSRSQSPRSQNQVKKSSDVLSKQPVDAEESGDVMQVCQEGMMINRAQPDEVYERIAQVGEGTYGQVFKAKSSRTGVLVALKKIRMEGEKDGFPITAMREVKLLQGLRHENVVRLHEMMLSKHSIYMIFEYLQHDLNGVLAQASIVFEPAHLKSLAAQLLSGLAYLHKHSILHRDLKCSNLLLDNEGTLKLADFGLARSYTKQGRAPRQRMLDYTNRVVTLWYRAPELLFGETSYGDAIDIWGAGCIFLELFMRKPAFQGQDEIHQVQLLFALLGPVRNDEWPGAKELPWFDLIQLASASERSSARDSELEQDDSLSHKAHIQKLLGGSAASDVVDVAAALLTYDPRSRLSAQEALSTLPYFSTNLPRPTKPGALLQTVEGEWHEFESRRAKRNAAAQALHAHVHREREQKQGEAKGISLHTEQHDPDGMPLSAKMSLEPTAFASASDDVMGSVMTSVGGGKDDDGEASA